MNISTNTFNSFRQKQVRYIVDDRQKIEANDFVIDENNILGIVEYISEKDGPFVRYLDDYGEFNKNLRKPIATSLVFYQSQKKLYKYILRLARIIVRSLEMFYPYVRMDFDGYMLYVRASNNEQLVTKKSNTNIKGQTIDYFSISLTPKYSCDFQYWITRKNKIKSRFRYTVLEHLFREIDIHLKEDRKIKFKISDNEPRNRILWEVFTDIRYKAFHFEYADDKH